MYIREASLVHIAEKLRSGELDLIYYVNDTCDWIEETEPVISALIYEENRRERLLQEADVLQKKYPNPSKRPPFFGILIGVKDLFNVDGFATQAGSMLPPDEFKGTEADVITDLKNKGALILGKTVSTEFAYFQPGPTTNPLNPNHTPGGSSSGSAAAVAAGYTPLAFGTQTIASIIRPASFCGIAGFKPSFGRVPTKGVFPFSQAADHIGFMTQTTEDIAFAASHILPNWKPTPHLDDVPIIGVPTGNFIEQADQDSMSNFLLDVVRLGDSEFELIHLDIFPDIEQINTNHRRLIAYEFTQNHKVLYQKYAHLYSSHSQQLIKDGSSISEQEHMKLLSEQMNFRNYIQDTMEKEGIDIWICPSTISRAPHGLESTGSPLMSLPWTHAGLPSVTMPLPGADEELPLGLQIIGKYDEDEYLISCLKLLKPS